MAITLNANKFLGALSNLIIYTLYQDNYKTGDSIDRTLSVFKSDNVFNGDGKLVITSDLPVVKDLTVNTSTLLTAVPPTVHEQLISVSKYKYIQLTVNKYLMRGAFADEYAMSNLISYLYNTMNVAKKLSIYSEIVAKISEINTNKKPTTITLTGLTKPSTNATAVETNAVRTYNTNLLYRTIIAELKNFGLGKEINITDGSSETFECYERPSNMIAILSPNTLASMDVDTLATLLNSNTITSNTNIEFLTMDIDDGSVVLLSKDKIQYGYFYEVATTFFDASNLNTQNFIHFSYYIDQVKRCAYELIKLTNFTTE